MIQPLENNTWRSSIIRSISWLLIFSVLQLQIGCNYYKVIQDKEINAEKIEKLKNAPNYVIIHQLDKAQRLSGITVNDDSQQISGTLSPLPPERTEYLTNYKDDTPNRYFVKKTKVKEANSNVLDEVHIYLKENFTDDISLGTIPLAAIDRIDVYDPHKGATSASYLLGGIGVVASTIMVIGVIVMLTKSSCPFIYVKNRNSYQFAGEIYSGAIYGCLERDDYLVLSEFDPEGDFYQLKISNQLKERQFTNVAELWSVKHAKGTLALPDKYGMIHAIENANMPITAYNSGADVLKQVLSKDENYFLFADKSAPNAINTIELSFERPADSWVSKLVVSARNSMWGDYVFGEFTKFFGNSYSSWIERQRSADSQEHIQWMQDQALVLKVYLETKNGWKYLDYFNLVGPLGERDLVMEIDLSEVSGETVNLRIEGGFMLWELNSVALDFSNKRLTPHPLTLTSAINQDERDVSSQLKVNDKLYLEQLNVGDETVLKFKKDSFSQPDVEQTLILHSRGYYEHVREYKGLPSIFALESFRQPGAFSDFSKTQLELLNNLVGQTTITAMATNK